MPQSSLVRKASKADVPTMAKSLARAFFDDPVMTWLFPNESTRPDKLVRMFAAQMTRIILPKDSLYTTDQRQGGALWEPPGTSKLGPWDLLRLAPSFGTIFGPRVPAVIKLLATIDAKHPAEPSWYLFTLGTDPAIQGQGFGRSLMEPVLSHCDTEGLPAYLESSKLANIAFYERAGFKVTGEITVKGGPTVWPMWREPR
ncbi:MAG: GNAT family N-acetyltransferase [Acidimicrobiales bacterium]